MPCENFIDYSTQVNANYFDGTSQQTKWMHEKCIVRSKSILTEFYQSFIFSPDAYANIFKHLIILFNRVIKYQRTKSQNPKHKSSWHLYYFCKFRKYNVQNKLTTSQLCIIQFRKNSNSHLNVLSCFGVFLRACTVRNPAIVAYGHYLAIIV